MEYRTLGRTGLKVSALGVGGHQRLYREGFLATPKEREYLIGRALDLGITYFDSGDYQEQESLGTALKALGRREECTIAATFTDYKLYENSTWDETCGRVMECVEKTLTCLQTDRVDVLTLCCDGLPFSEVSTEGAIEACRQAQKDGKIRFFGMSGHRQDVIRASAERYDAWDTVMFPYNFMVSGPERTLFPVLRRHNVGIISMKSLLARMLFSLNVDLRASTGEAVSLGAAAIKWVLRNPDVSLTIVAMNSPGEVYECVQAVEQGTLSDGEREVLDRARQVFMKDVAPGMRDFLRQAEEEGSIESAGEKQA